jgi:uncharacterized protein YuzE
MIDMEAERRKYRDDCQRILVENADLEERIRAANLWISYDQDTDILYVSFGAFGRAVMHSLTNEYLLRLDLDGDGWAITGVELMDAKELLPTYPALAQLVQRVGLLCGDERVLIAFASELRGLLAASAAPAQVA